MEIRRRFIAAAARAMVLGPVVIMGVFLAACSKDAPRPATAAGAVDSTVAAMVAGQPIYVSDVQLEAEAAINRLRISIACMLLKPS